MNGNKLDKACRLYLAMSELDDKTATEVLKYRRSTSRGLRVTLIMAACVTLLVCSILLGAIVASFDAPNTQPPNTETVTLSSVLNDYRDQIDEPNSSITIDSLPELINSEPSLIWKYQDSEEYHVKTISSKTLSELLSEIKNGELVVENASELNCLVWITSGSGEVYSPYLKPSSGNVGYGVLFEYDPELQPSEDFISTVISLLD